MSKEDVVCGKVMNGKRWDTEKKEYVPAKYTTVIKYKLDERGIPIKIGTWKDANGKEHDTFAIEYMMKIADSSLMKVKALQAKFCNLYLSQKERY